MQTVILHKLREIEEKHKIKLLFSCESGSRGWEFPSPDSDYDVRFIYARPFNSYLSVLERDDNLRFPINDELDVYGWDIRKVLKLIRKSNTTPFEWLQSPIIYLQEEGFRDELWDLCQNYFDARSNIHHYLGIARGALDTMENGNEIKIKKLFYVLRPLLSAKWCLERDSIAPMTIGPLMDLLPGELHRQVSDLIQLKAGSAEGFVIKISESLKFYINDEFTRVGLASNDLQRKYFKVEELDAFFVKTIKRYDY
jgi:predicted nucleotidyltransferase